LFKISNITTIFASKITNPKKNFFHGTKKLFFSAFPFYLPLMTVIAPITPNAK